MDETRDFFISYSLADQNWAEWIAWVLEMMGYSTILDKWDFRPGSNFIMELNTASQQAKRTIALLSPDYIRGLNAQPEWAMAFAQDPTGQRGTLLPIRVGEVELSKLLRSIIYIDLVGLDAEACRETLQKGVQRTRARPSSKPSYPDVDRRTESFKLNISEKNAEHPAFPGSAPLVFFVPHLRNPYFSGRNEILEELYDTFRGVPGTTNVDVIALTGPDGMGKTQIAIEYAHLHRQRYRYVLWVNAFSSETLSTDYIQLASLLNTTKNPINQQETIAAVKQWLGQQNSWLLVCDGVNDLDQLCTFLPETIGLDRGHLLLTMQAPENETIQAMQQFGPLVKIPVNTFSPHEGAALLLRRSHLLPLRTRLYQAQEEQSAQALAIVQELEGMPLALDQAGAYIENTQVSLPEYIALYRTCKETTTSGPEAEVIITTWSLAFQQVQRESPFAADILYLCAFLASNAIPEEILAAGELRNSAKNTLNSQDPQSDIPLEIISEYALIHRDIQKNTLNIHPLVQQLLRNSLEDNLQQQWAMRAVRAVSQIFPSPEGTAWTVSTRYVEHALSCVELIHKYQFDFLEAAHLLYRLGYYLYQQDEYDEAAKLYHEALRIYELSSELVKPNIATSLDGLAHTYQNQRKYDLAEEFYKKALDIWRTTFGPDNAETLQALNNLASLYLLEQKYHQAELYYVWILDIQQQTLRLDDPDVADTLKNLANIYKIQGDYQKAEKQYLQALTISEQVFGTEHLNTAEILESLIGLYKLKGQYTQAIEVCQRARSILQTVYNQKHPDTLAILQKLTVLYLLQGQYKRAEEHYMIWQPLLKTLYKPDSYPIGESYAIGGRIALALGDAHRANSLFEDAQLIFQGDKETPPSSLINCLIDLADLYRMMGEYHRARKCYQQALDICTQKSVQTLDQAACLAGLAVLPAKPLDNEQQSRRAIEQVLAFYNQAFMNEEEQEHRYQFSRVEYYQNRVITLGTLVLQLEERKDPQAEALFIALLKLLEYPPAFVLPGMPEQIANVHHVQDWLSKIMGELRTAWESSSRLARAAAFNRAIGKLADRKQSLDGLMEGGQLVIRRVTELWRGDVARQAEQAGKIAISEYVPSPYIFTPPITHEYLTGRDDKFEDINRLWARSGQRNSIVINGHRRMGKTSVAQAIMYRCKLGDTTHAAYLSLEGHPLRHEGELYQLLASRLWLIFRPALERPNPKDFTGGQARSNFDLLLLLIDRIIGNGSLVIILDEFENLYRQLGNEQANTTIAFLRNQTTSHNWLALALVGLSDLDDMRLSYQAPLLGWANLHIGFLDKDQTKNILANPSQNPDFPLTYSEEALNRLADETFGQPYLMQVIGDRLVQRFNRIVFRQHKEHSGKFEIEDVEAVLNDPEFFDTAAAYFDGVWGQALRGQQGEIALLKALALSNTSLSKEYLQTTTGLQPALFTIALETLKRHDVVIDPNKNQNGDHKQVKYAVPLMQRWVQKTQL